MPSFGTLKAITYFSRRELSKGPFINEYIIYPGEEKRKKFRGASENKYYIIGEVNLYFSLAENVKG